jgi:aspartyl-tRNA(Asn)/glutamyl-tRNA(Gln) amidotransferase subunit C
MSIDTEKVRQIAFLARIKVPEDHLDGLAGELNQILGFVEQLAEVDTDGVEPMTSVADVRAPMREDVITDGGYPDKVLANAPDRVDDFYTVPKVVE